ncbi:hypothetical protein IAQ61_000951 [Plenodomus lingam]|uniref:uncharacterized protein n=1 Tax=Leptosphaeria maculans TaxID=5022 RepID=UPI003324764C|nr:hypothetical protein IAQ61_000951 [Plenodomus lingam]
MSSNTMTRVPDKASRVKALVAATSVVHPANIAKGDDCPICLEPLVPNKGHAQEQAQVASGTLPPPPPFLHHPTNNPPAPADPAIKTKICGHTAHASCLLRWTEEHSSCVYCREEMFQETRWEWCYVAPYQAGKRGFCVSMEEWNERMKSCKSEEEEEWVKGFKSTWVDVRKVRYRY